MTAFGIVDGEVAKAYIDCSQLEDRFARGEGDKTLSNQDRLDALFDEVSKIRNLKFKASLPLTPQEAFEIMEKYCNSYNDFEAKFIKLLPKDCLVYIAREGSVCLYVIPGAKEFKYTEKIRDSMEFQEFSITGENEIRLWWD